MEKAAAPIDLLRELREVFKAEAYEARRREKLSQALGNRRAAAARVYAFEHAIKKIDATLRDWA